ncbi:hypothetical protein C8J57DRAFT_1514049 [Mycena rebaudengoi]|nr:hypothetical protein C8J57DRAFT_1514049 [Mycena rebaudengoi]
MEAENTQALDVLASPAAALVYLERTTRSSATTLRKIIDPIFLTCGQAVFWPSTEGAAADVPSSQRELMGEIHLKPTLQPSTDMGEFIVEYSVLVFPFQATGFKAEGYKPILRHKVDIVTVYAAGPRAKTFTPASYETRNALVDQYYLSKAMGGIPQLHTGGEPERRELLEEMSYAGRRDRAADAAGLGGDEDEDEAGSVDDDDAGDIDVDAIVDGWESGSDLEEEGSIDVSTEASDDEGKSLNDLD